MLNCVPNSANLSGPLWPDNNLQPGLKNNDSARLAGEKRLDNDILLFFAVKAVFASLLFDLDLDASLLLDVAVGGLRLRHDLGLRVGHPGSVTIGN